MQTYSFIAVVAGLILTACNLGSGRIDLTNTPTRMPTATTESTATPAPTDTPIPGIVGTYSCAGHEGGMLAGASILTLDPDGRYLDRPAPVVSRSDRRGDWVYEQESGIVQFPNDTLFAEGEYDPEDRHLFIRFLNGKTIVHAESGTLSCEPAPSLAPED